ncbi:MAG: c-type cytochrome [Gammaproteobacteria bacterium]|nr:c-type cytochrome [Gammaproteobacteria bacterium]
MKPRTFGAGAVILLGSAVATIVEAQTDVVLRLGKAQFDQHCAVCHGVQGAGDGPLADLLTVPAENLATLAQRHGGRFPRLDVYQAIDGRRGIRAHGTDQMPIWGNRFKADAFDGGPRGAGLLERGTARMDFRYAALT